MLKFKILLAIVLIILMIPAFFCILAGDILAIFGGLAIFVWAGLFYVGLDEIYYKYQKKEEIKKETRQ